MEFVTGDVKARWKVVKLAEHNTTAMILSPPLNIQGYKCMSTNQLQIY